MQCIEGPACWDDASWPWPCHDPLNSKAFWPSWPSCPLHHPVALCATNRVPPCHQQASLTHVGEPFPLLCYRLRHGFGRLTHTHTHTQAKFKGTTLSLQERGRVLRLAITSAQRLVTKGQLHPARIVTRCNSLVPLGGPALCGLNRRPYFACRAPLHTHILKPAEYCEHA